MRARNKIISSSNCPRSRSRSRSSSPSPSPLLSKEELLNHSECSMDNGRLPTTINTTIVSPIEINYNQPELVHTIEPPHTWQQLLTNELGLIGSSHYVAHVGNALYCHTCNVPLYGQNYNAKYIITQGNIYCSITCVKRRLNSQSMMYVNCNFCLRSLQWETCKHHYSTVSGRKRHFCSNDCMNGYITLYRCEFCWSEYIRDKTVDHIMVTIKNYNDRKFKYCNAKCWTEMSFTKLPPSTKCLTCHRVMEDRSPTLLVHRHGENIEAFCCIKCKIDYKISQWKYQPYDVVNCSRLAEKNWRTLLCTMCCHHVVEAHAFTLMLAGRRLYCCSEQCIATLRAVTRELVRCVKCAGTLYLYDMFEIGDMAHNLMRRDPPKFYCSIECCNSNSDDAQQPQPQPQAKPQQKQKQQQDLASRPAECAICSNVTPSSRCITCSKECFEKLREKHVQFWQNELEPAYESLSIVVPSLLSPP